MRPLLANSYRKPIFRILAFFLLASLLLTLFHYHSGGQHTTDCAVCRLVRQIVSFCLLALCTSLVEGPDGKRFFVSFPEKFFSLLSASALKDRAPPFLF